MSYQRRVADLIYNRPGTCMAVMLVATVLLGAGLYNFSMIMSHEDMLPETEEVKHLQRVQDEFFDMEMASILTRGEPVLTPTYFGEVADTVEAWLSKEHIRGALLTDPTTSILSVPTMLAHFNLTMEGIAQPTIEQVLAKARSYGSETEIRTLALNYVNNPLVPQIYRDGFWMLLPRETAEQNRDLDPSPRRAAVFLQLSGDMDIRELEDVLLDIESIAKGNTRRVQTYMYADGILGHYMVEAEMMMEPIFMVLVFILFIVLLVAFRRVSDPAITMLSLLLAILWQVGMISWLGYSLDLFQFMVPLLLMGLGVDFSLHLVMNYREGLGTEGTNEERLRSAVDKVFRVTVPALVLATVTTMVGFGSSLIFDYPIIQKFGLGAAFGILAILLVNLFFVLPWRVLRDRRSAKQLEKGAIFVERIDQEPGPMVRGGYRTVRAAPVLLALLVLAAVPGLALAPTMQGTYDPRDELIEDQDMSIAATALLDDFLMGTETMYVRVEGDWTSPAEWQDLYASLDELEASDYVNKVDGEMVADWVGPILPAYAMLDPGIAALWVNVTEDGQTVPASASEQNLTALLDALHAAAPEVSNYLHGEGGVYTSVLLVVPTTTNWGEKGLELQEQVEEAFGGRFDKVQTTGTPIIWGVGFDVLTSYMLQSIVFVVTFAFFFLIALYSVVRRDPLLGVVSGVPPILVLGWLFVTMWLAGIPLNMMTAMVGAIIIGLGIDYPIHIVNRWVYERDNGGSLRSVYNITLGSTGREIVFSGVTTLLALGAFFLLPMEAMRLFGIVLFIAIFYAMVGALVLTPLMLRFWKPKGVGDDAGEEDG